MADADSGHPNLPSQSVIHVDDGKELRQFQFQNCNRLCPLAWSAMGVSGITLRNLIRVAWNLPDERIFGEPSWTDDTRFDIIAKGTTDNPADAPLITTIRYDLW